MQQKKVHLLFKFIVEKWKKVIFLFLILALLSQYPFWLILTIAIIVPFYLKFICFLKKIKPGILNKMFRAFFLLLNLFIAAIYFRLLIGDVYTIQSDSMEDTLHSEDVVLVNKLVYGTKIPQSLSEIPWLSLFYSAKSHFPMETEKNCRSYKRLPGIGFLKQGDVLIYEIKKMFFVVKRCVAVAGDTLQLTKGNIYVNGKKYLEPLTVKATNRFKTENKQKLYAVLDSLGILSSVYFDGNKNDWLTGTLSNEKINILKNFGEIEMIERILDKPSDKRELFAKPRGTQ